MRTARQAAQAFKDKTRNEVGMCLKEVQACYESGHAYPSAISQWDNAKTRHKNDRTPPIGAPVFWRGGKYGHVAIYVGNGKVRSTDAGGRGIMGTVSLDWFARAWGYTYVGWTGDLAGRKIEFTDTIDVYVSKLKPGVDDSDSVKQLRFRLIKRGFLTVEAPLSLDRPGNKYTPAVERAVKKWQTKKGYKPTGVLTNKQARAFFEPAKKVKVHPE